MQQGVSGGWFVGGVVWWLENWRVMLISAFNEVEVEAEAEAELGNISQL